MGRPGLPGGHGEWITPCNQIHSCWMRFVFDALFLDETYRVLHVAEHMNPWRISKWVRGGRIVLELPAGTVSETHTAIGDQLCAD